MKNLLSNKIVEKFGIHTEGYVEGYLTVHKNEEMLKY